MKLLGYICSLLLSLTCYAQSVLPKPEEIPVFIRDDVYEDYLKFLDGRAVLSIVDFRGITMRRDVADMVLLQQALALGGFTKKFYYQPGKFNFRNTKLLETGDSLLSFDTYWLSDAKALSGKVFVSEPVVRRGEYLAGIYSSPENTAVFSIKTLTDLRQFSGVSTPKWRTDWDTMTALPLKELVREDEWLSQARMVHMRWVDFMLMPFFHDKDGIYQLEQLRLKVVPGVAILLNDSRHFVISKTHPDGRYANEALNKGLRILRENGRIEQLYKQAGFMLPQGSVKILNVPPPEPKASSTPGTAQPN
jgi:hypothetical protein